MNVLIHLLFNPKFIELIIYNQSMTLINFLLFPSLSQSCIQFLLSNHLGLVKREPIITFGNLSDFHNKLISLLDQLWFFYQNLALRSWYCKDPILTIKVIDLNFETTVKESHVYFFIGVLSDALNGDVHLYKLGLFQERIFV